MEFAHYKCFIIIIIITIIIKSFCMCKLNVIQKPMIRYVDSGIVKRATLLFNLFWNMGAKQVAHFCRPFYGNFTYIHRYRLAPENPFPAGFDDCVEVVKSLLETGDEYGIDTNRIVLAGSSAGGNLAAAVTHHLLNENRKLAGQVGCLKKNVDVLLQLMKWPPTQTF